MLLLEPQRSLYRHAEVGCECHMAKHTVESVRFTKPPVAMRTASRRDSMWTPGMRGNPTEGRTAQLTP